MKEWITACALLVSIIVQLLAITAIGNAQKYNITNVTAYQHSTTSAYKENVMI